MPAYAYWENDLALPAPAPLTFRYDHYAARSECEPHRHPWGQLGRISLGLAEVEVAGRYLVFPADYLLWIPADTAHSARMLHAMEFVSVYLDARLSARLPAAACLIELTPVVRALLDDFSQRRLQRPETEWDVRQAELLVEHVTRSPCKDSFLPEATDRQLRQLLQALRDNPADDTTLAQWAQRVHSTERTLARRFQRELGMSFVQWRNRVRLLQALAWLKEGWAVHEIAARLGYGAPSAFIAMFRKQTGLAPERYRQSQLQGCAAY